MRIKKSPVGKIVSLCFYRRLDVFQFFFSVYMNEVIHLLQGEGKFYCSGVVLLCIAFHRIQKILNCVKEIHYTEPFRLYFVIGRELLQRYSRVHGHQKEAMKDLQILLVNPIS